MKIKNEQFTKKYKGVDCWHRRKQSQKKYIAGLLYDIVAVNTDISQLTENIISYCEIEKDQEKYQKIVLGEIHDCVEKSKMKNQVIAVSVKIAEYLKQA